MAYTIEQTTATPADIAHPEVTDDTQKLRIALGNPIWNR